MLTALAEHCSKTSEEWTKKRRSDDTESRDKSPDKSGKTKQGVMCPASGNDDFFPRRSERIFLSSTSSLTSPTGNGVFDMPNVNKKKNKPSSGKVSTKKKVKLQFCFTLSFEATFE